MTESEAIPAVDTEHSSVTGTQLAGDQTSNKGQIAATYNENTVNKKPSFITRSVQALFGFRKTSLTLFTIVTYLVVLVLIFWAKHRSLEVPSEEPHILATSWLDLQTISKKPHTYISHANDEVRDYILSRVKTLANSSNYITVSDDKDNGVHLFQIRDHWSNNNSEYSPLHYFESGNVLVKIEGTEPDTEGILLSAHYDSVPTAFGSTDDGAGVASLLGVLEYYASAGVDRPRRSIVINFNNNEEFGLFGASAFFEHPWSKLVKYFINLEGTGTGERAVLFRTTDYDIGKLYQTVRSPFATSIFQEGFASGLVHSETDYRVYKEKGLRGFDIAFYKPRSQYHTAQDSIKYTSKNALWHMLSNTLDLTIELASADKIDEDSKTQAVFFDILGFFFFVVPITAVYSFNIFLLVAVPIVLILFGIVIQKRKIWSTGFSWIVLPISFAVSLVGAKIVNDTIYYFNPFIVSRDFYSPLITVSSVFLFLNYVILTIVNSIWSVHDFKLVITLEVFAGLWGALLFSTIREKDTVVYSGEYLITVIYLLYSVSTILGLFSISIASRRETGSKHTDPHYVDEEEATEQSPLLENSQETVDPYREEEREAHPAHNSFAYDWSLQFFILVPFNLLLSLISVELILEAINQTVQESLASNELVFRVILLSSVVLTLPLLSFSYKLNYLFGLLLVFSIITGGFVSVLKEPFSQSAPMKLRFAQTIDLNSDSRASVVEIYGRENTIGDVLNDLPSIKNQDISISCESKPDGNELCSYEGERPYLIDGTKKDNKLDSYVTVDILKSGDESAPSPYAPLTAEIAINAPDNRFCSLSFNSTSYNSADHSGKSPLRVFTYYHDKPSNKSVGVSYVTIPSGPSTDKDGNEVFKLLSGIDEVHMHKLNWEQSSYHIGLQWIPKWLEDGEEQEPSNSPNNKLGIKISCYWGEYDDVAIVDGVSHRKIPAYDELLEYAPLTRSFSNRFEGLVRVDKYISL